MSQQIEKREYNKKKVCVCCDKWLRGTDEYINVDQGLLCYHCDETDTDDPEITIKIFTGKGDEVYDDYGLIEFGNYRIHYNDWYEYKGHFKRSYHSIDEWRGYSDITSDHWSEIALVNVRAFDPSLEKLEQPSKEFTNRLIDTIGKYALVQARTSNCMVVNMSIWVKNEDREKALEIKEQIIKEFDLNEDDL